MGQNQKLDLTFKEAQYLTEIYEPLYVHICRNTRTFSLSLSKEPPVPETL